MCGMDCEQEETKRESHCIDCSREQASRDLSALAKFKQNITIASNEKCFPSALLAAFISRQTRAGVELEGTDGWIYRHGYDEKICIGSNEEVAKCVCYGLMHTPKGRFILCHSVINIQNFIHCLFIFNELIF